VRHFEIAGSSVFSDSELAALTGPFENREVSPAELQGLRDLLTRIYVERGYLTSGAVIPDQQVRDGVVQIQVVEGQLEDVDVESTGRLRASYVAERVRLGAAAPLNVARLEEQLQLLQENPRIARIDAELAPGRSRGWSRLRVGVEEASPWRATLEASNERTPTVGSEGMGLLVRHHNLTGWGDLLSLSAERSEGFADRELRYGIPLTARDTWLEFGVRRSSSEVVEEPFDDLEIEGDAVSYGVSLSHPILRTPGHDLRVGLTAEHRRSDNQFVDGSFSFTPGSEDGKVKISVLRGFQEWTARGRDRVVAARSTFNLGISALRATTHSDAPDSRYFAWLGQLQLAQRLPERFGGTQLLLRGDVQLANDPLLSLEQFAIGGLRSVRGYRENQLVRDNGWVASAELRVPLLVAADGRELLEVRPFFDIGQAWNDGHNAGPATLSSLGTGIVVRPLRHFQVEVYWGGRLRQVERPQDSDMQDHGFHLLARVDY
jgi:hemolysin activation/secretion protein